MRNASPLLVLALFIAPSARAQDVQFFGGYSYLRTTGSHYENTGLQGWNAAAAINLGSLGFVADFSNHYGASTANFTPIGSRGHGSMYLFGPQYSVRLIPRVTPFVHALFGGVNGSKITLTAGGSLGPGGQCPAPACSGSLIAPERAFAMAFGGGLDVKLEHHLWIRLVQVDYVRQNFSNGAMTSPRVSAGVVLRFP